MQCIDACRAFQREYVTLSAMALVDLNLLTALDALLAEGSVAGAELG